MNINFKAQVLPHLIAIALFYLATVLFFSPVIFEGKNISQHDILQHEGAAHETRAYYEETGEVALWTNSMFGGMPSYLVGAEFTGDLLKYVYKLAGLGLPHPVRIVFLSFVCFYILLLSFKVKLGLSIVGSMAWGFNTFNLIGIMAGHNSKIAAVAFIPLVIAGIHLVFQNKKLLGFALTALATALELRVNHLQITYYLLIIIGVYSIFQLVFFTREKKLPEFGKIVTILIAAAFLGLAANIGKIWTTYEYSKYSTRGKSDLTASGSNSSGLDRDYAFDYSNGISEPMVLFIPNFLGGASTQTLSIDSNVAKALRTNGYNRQQVRQQIQSVPTYWGSQRLSAPYYAGSIMVFALVIGLFFVEAKYKYWLISIIVFSIMLSWGKNFAAFNYLLFDYLPGYNKFRSVTFTIIIAIFGINLLGILGINEIIKEEDQKVRFQHLKRALFIAGGILLFFVVFAGVFSFRGAIDAQLPEWFTNALRKDRQSMLRSDAIRALVLILLFAAVLWAYFKKKLSNFLSFSLMILLVSGDMWTVGKRYLKDSMYKKNVLESRFQKTDADHQILKDSDKFYRVLNLNNPFNESETSYFHASVGGYHGAKIGRYQELIEHGIQSEMQKVIESLRAGERDLSDANLLNMLNTKYIKFGDGASNVILNRRAYGNAWFVNEVIRVNSADDELTSTINNVNKSIAVVDVHKYSVSEETPFIGTAELTNYSPNQMTYTTQNEGHGLLVLSDIYYPTGWTVTIDGQEAEIIRANYVLRAVEVPAGQHEIVFTFSPNSYIIGNTIMWISSIVLYLMFGLAIFYEIKSRLSDNPRAAG